MHTLGLYGHSKSIMMIAHFLLGELDMVLKGVYIIGSCPTCQFVSLPAHDFLFCNYCWMVFELNVVCTDLVLVFGLVYEILI